MDARIMMGSSQPVEARALFARMATPPSNSRKAQITKLIRALKTAGVWSKLDVLYVFAAADSQAALLNWKSTSWNATNHGATFGADRGFTGDGVDDYISTSYGLADGQFTSASHTFGLILRSYVSGTRSMGVTDGGTGRALSFRPSDYSAEVSDLGVGVSVGLSSVANVSAIRTGNAVELYRNGLLAGSASAPPGSINPGIKFAILASEAVFAGTPQVGNTAGRVAAAYMGGALNSNQVAALNSALQAYLSAVGA